MMNIKKTLSIITSAAIAFCAFAGNVIQADALGYDFLPTSTSQTDPRVPPEGYEFFNGTEEYERCKEYFPNYIILKESRAPVYFVAYSEFEMHRVKITVTNDGWKDIYSKYSEIIGSDSTEIIEDNGTVIIPGVSLSAKDETTDFIAAYEAECDAFTSKREAAIEMCEEMYKAGCIKTAKYTPVISKDRQLLKTTGLYLKNYAGTAEDLEKILSDTVPNLNINYYAEVDGELLDSYHIGGFKSAIEYVEALEILKNMEGDHELTYNIFVYEETGMEMPSIGNFTIDIVAAIEEECAMIASCDTDANGTVEITDATAILESYANTAAGVAAASEENPMDVNGDGAVGIDDATFVLTVYAELAAGLR